MSLLHQTQAAAILMRAQTSPFERLDRLPRAMMALAPWGVTLAGSTAAAAARYPRRIAVQDTDRVITYRRLWRRSRNLAAGFQAAGIGPDSTVGILARNHVGFVEWLVAASATGAKVVLLNTGFGGPQLADVVDHEGIDVILHDDEFADIVAACDKLETRPRLYPESRLDEMAVKRREPRPQRRQGALIILTSGTTGRPKGASRSSGDPNALTGVAAVLERVPFRLGDVQVVPAPFFHAWGLTMLIMGISRSATTITARRFEAETTLAQLSAGKARVLAAVPVMVARILELDPEIQVAHLTPSLSIIATSGSALGAKLAEDILARFGPVLYNLYGSTEVAIATIADPDDLLDDPATAGRVAFGVEVKVLDDDGRPVPDGQVGRVFVGGAMRFEGYTNGTTKQQIGGLMSTGDLGVFRHGRLFIEGREDDMIVSGGENVYPVEVEQLLAHHPGVLEAAVVGVPDDDYGQVLAAFLALEPGAKWTARQVKDHVKAELARHKVPRHVRFVDELPRNPTGKILRRQLVADIVETGR